MNINDVKAKIDFIKFMVGEQGDYEAAHYLEDDLRRKFIEHVAKTVHYELKDMAELILAVEDLDFPRNCT